MTSNQKILCQKLAHLFYAIAMADKKIEREEKLRIIEFVKIHWNHSFNDTSGEEIIYNTLGVLIANKTHADDAYHIFEVYCKKNPTLFDHALKLKIIETCNGITHSFSHKRKSEVIMLTKLGLLFKNNA